MSRLQARGVSCWSPQRGDATVFERPLGHVIYGIGVTADFRTRTLETVGAHVCALVEFIARARFDSLLYLSSTRVYKGAPATDEESPLRVSPSDADDFYNLTKLTGEALCLTNPRDTMPAQKPYVSATTSSRASALPVTAIWKLNIPSRAAYGITTKT